MAYIGNVPAEKYSALTQQTFSSPTGTSFTLSTAVTNSRDIALFIDNVRQDPTSYTAVGTALTTSTIASPSTMYCLFIGKTVETISPPAGSVDSSHLVTGSVDDGHITGVAANKLTGTVDSAQIAAGSVDLSHLSATGTPSASLALKGDFTWGTAGGPSLGSGSELLRTNSNQINQNITIPSGTNASSVGPISVGASYSVAVNGVWAII
tara:strand:- start:126 stop:752 length:627 start_codon:yes stop_codon:yes gene_type:complete